MKLEKQAYFVYPGEKESKLNYSATKGKKSSSKKLHDKNGFLRESYRSPKTMR
jgi:hypothetical protein